MGSSLIRTDIQAWIVINVPAWIRVSLDDNNGIFTEVIIPNVSGSSGNYPVVNSDVRIRVLTVEDGAEVIIPDNVNLQVGMPEE